MSLLLLLVLYGRSRCGLRLNIVGLTFAISWFSSFAIIILAFLAFLSFSFSFSFSFLLQVSMLIEVVQIIIGPMAFIPVLIIGPKAFMRIIPFIFIPFLIISFFTHHVRAAFPSSFSSAFSFLDLKNLRPPLPFPFLFPLPLPRLVCLPWNLLWYHV